jgi:hypothetical protein
VEFVPPSRIHVIFDLCLLVAALDAEFVLMVCLVGDTEVVIGGRGLYTVHLPLGQFSLHHACAFTAMCCLGWM